MTLPSPQIAQTCGDLRGGATRQLILLRHAEADFHGRFCGHSNPSLSSRGRASLPAILQGLMLASISPTAIWSSDLRRAMETADPIAKHFRLDLATSHGLREMNFGSWEGLSWSEVEVQNPEDARVWIERFPHHRPPQGESFLEFQARVIEQLESLAKRVEPGCTIVITHAGVIRTAIGWVLGIPDDRISRIVQNHGAITILEKIHSHWSVAAMNLALCRFTHRNNKDGDDRP